MPVPRKIKAGTLLLKERPFVYVLSSKLHTQYCENCFVKRSDLMKCSGCKYVYYCSRVCQRESWSVHKSECPNMQKVAPRIVPDAGRLLARLIRKLQGGGNRQKSYYSDGRYRTFKDLMSHYSDLKSNSQKMEHFISLVAVLSEFMGREAMPTSGELMGMFGRMCVNSFNICDAEMASLGTGIYLAASICDHSCKPNAVATFEGTTLNIRAVAELSALDWSQIFISYIDIVNTTSNRRRELQDTYYFLCECPRCVDTSEGSYVAGGVCPACNGCVDAKTFVCGDCGQTADLEFVKQFQDAVELSNAQLKQMQDIAYLDVCKMCLRIQTKVLHKFHHQHVRTLDLAFQSSIDFGQWKEAQAYGKELIDAFKKYYGAVDPLLGLLYLKLGKIMLYEGKSGEALQFLELACDNLKITHGETSKLYQMELLPLVDQARIECNCI